MQNGAKFIMVQNVIDKDNLIRPYFFEDETIKAATIDTSHRYETLLEEFIFSPRITKKLTRRTLVFQFHNRVISRFGEVEQVALFLPSRALYF